MEMRRCTPCGGSGRLMGGGMMFRDCEFCHGSGKIAQPEDDITYLQMKMTDGYQEAINNIKAVDENITTEKAEEMFKNEFEKIENKTDGWQINLKEPKKRGRPKK